MRDEVLAIAISSIVPRWRVSSASIAAASSGSCRWEVVQSHAGPPALLGHRGRLALDGGDLVDAALVSAALELGVEERVEDRLGASRADVASRQRDHVGVVVQARIMRAISGSVTMRGAHAGHLVGGDRHADARAAHEHAEVGLARGDRVRDCLGVIGVVDRVLAVRPHVDHARCPCARK